MTRDREPRAKAISHPGAHRLAKGIECYWRVVPADQAREMHARALFDDANAYQPTASSSRWFKAPAEGRGA